MQLFMKRKLARCAPLGLALLLCAGGAAAQMYKWTDAKGVVHFSDQPPRGDAKVERKAFGGGASGVALPYALAEAVRKSPVVLYTSSPCLPCEQGRVLLQQRGVPYAEKTVSSSEDKQMLLDAAGTPQVPVLLVGGAKRIGFQAAAWNSALSDAGYPARRMLPAEYKNPAAEAAAPTPPRPLARELLPEPPPEPPRPPTPAPDSPPGFKF